MTKPEILRDIQLHAQAQRDNGASVVIDYSLLTVTVELANGGEFFFQGEEASELLSDTEHVDPRVTAEDMILWLAQGW